MDDTGDAAEDLGKSLEESGKDAEKSGKKFEGLGSTLKKAGEAIVGVATAVGGAAAAVGAGMFKMAESAAATGKEVNNMSQKLGLSREGYQEWEYVLRKSGASIDVMSTGMKTLQKTMGGLTEDGSKSADAFKAVGISFDEIKGKSPEYPPQRNCGFAGDPGAMNLTIKALQNMPAGADRTTAALKLFGKGAICE